MSTNRMAIFACLEPMTEDEDRIDPGNVMVTGVILFQSDNYLSITHQHGPHDMTVDDHLCDSVEEATLMFMAQTAQLRADGEVVLLGLFGEPPAPPSQQSIGRMIEQIQQMLRDHSDIPAPADPVVGTGYGMYL